MAKYDCDLSDIRKVQLITENFTEILSVDTDHKVVFKTYDADYIDGESSKLIAYIFINFMHAYAESLIHS